MVSMFPLLQAAATFSREYTGAWAMLGAGIGAGLLAAPAIVRAQGQPIVIRAGALKLIHSIAPYFYDQFVPAGYKVEVLPFETPTECKNALFAIVISFLIQGKFKF